MRGYADLQPLRAATPVDAGAPRRAESRDTDDLDDGQLRTDWFSLVMMFILGAMVTAVALLLAGIPDEVHEVALSWARTVAAWFIDNWNTPRILFILIPALAMTALAVVMEKL